MKISKVKYVIWAADMAHVALLSKHSKSTHRGIECNTEEGVEGQEEDVMLRWRGLTLQVTKKNPLWHTVPIKIITSLILVIKI